MARITRNRVYAAGERRQRPLSERIVDENLGSYDHLPRRRERLGLAIADGADAPTLSSADRAVGHHDEELADAAWLYAWSHAALRAGRGTPDI
jgi:hypothetical protein